MTANYRQFYCATPLQAGKSLILPEELRHRLAHVLRLRAGATLHLFDGLHGTFAATLADDKARTAQVGGCVRPLVPPPPLALLVGLPKRDAWETIVRQATELGVTEIVPLLAEFSVPTRLNMERAHALAVEAAEQCERDSIPILQQPQPLLKGVEAWLAANPSQTLAWANEQGGQFLGHAVAVLVGPEGGFSPAEHAWLATQSQVKAVTLGPTVLRADTAATVALALARQG